jgi:hypothetical protein
MMAHAIVINSATICCLIAAYLDYGRARRRNWWQTLARGGRRRTWWQARAAANLVAYTGTGGDGPGWPAAKLTSALVIIM